MAAIEGIDVTALQDFSECLERAPRTLLRELAKAFQAIGRYDIEKIRAQVRSNFNLKSSRAANAFRFKATEPGKATGFDKLFISEFSRWKAAELFETGGTITGSGKKLTILTDAGRGPSGRARYSSDQIRAMVMTGECRFVPTPRGTLLIQSKGGTTKKGHFRKNSRDVVLAVLRKSVQEKKRLDFYQIIDSGKSVHQEILEYAVENTLVEIATG